MSLAITDSRVHTMSGDYAPRRNAAGFPGSYVHGKEPNEPGRAPALELAGRCKTAREAARNTPRRDALAAQSRFTSGRRVHEPISIARPT